jgi:hypothetical protein
MYVLIRSTYIICENKHLRMYFMTILLCRNCTSSYKSDEIVRFSALWLEMLDFWKLKKYNKSVKNYFQMKFESADLTYRPRGIQKCNKMGGITDSTKRYGFWKISTRVECHVLKKGAVNHRWSIDFLCNAWEVWTFEMNFMFDKLLRIIFMHRLKQ